MNKKIKSNSICPMAENFPVLTSYCSERAPVFIRVWISTHSFKFPSSPSRYVCIFSYPLHGKHATFPHYLIISPFKIFNMLHHTHLCELLDPPRETNMELLWQSMEKRQNPVQEQPFQKAVFIPSSWKWFSYLLLGFSKYFGEFLHRFIRFVWKRQQFW